MDISFLHLSFIIFMHSFCINHCIIIHLHLACFCSANCIHVMFTHAWSLYLGVARCAPNSIVGESNTYYEKSKIPLLFFKKKRCTQWPFLLPNSQLFFFPIPRAFLLLLSSSSLFVSFFRWQPFLPPSSLFREPLCFSNARWLFFFHASCCFSLLRVRFFFRSLARCCSSILHRGKVYVPFVVCYCFHCCFHWWLLKYLGHPQ